MSGTTSSLLGPYSPGPGGWTPRDVAHLLHRTGFGATRAETDQARAAGLENTLDRLLESRPESKDFEEAQSLLREAADSADDLSYLKTWQLYRIHHTTNPLVESMTLFWSNVFATSNAKVKSPKAMGKQNDLFRREALGNFGRLTHAVAKDEAMVRWLDMDQNTKFSPNENFARELMELFCLGIGRYSEVDVREAARAFTGVAVRESGVWLDPNRHDDQEKFVLGRRGPLTGDDVVDLCLEQPACAERLARRLLVAFVRRDPSQDTIAALAGVIRAHRYEMKPVLKELFSSEIFFNQSTRGDLIKSPVQLVMGALRTLEVQANLTEAAALQGRLGQSLFEPPNVKGWDGGRTWINAASMLDRVNFAYDLIEVGRFGELHATLGESFAELSDGAQVEAACDLLFGRRLSTPTMNRWTRYVQESRVEGRARERALLHLMIASPEYQLI